MGTSSKLSFLISLSTMLLLTAVLLSGCAPTSSETESSPAIEGVRQPKGNPETFWIKLKWSDFTPEEQALWGKLGWNKDSWAGKAPPPSTEELDWSELSSEERKAAEQLGYGQFYWDSN